MEKSLGMGPGGGGESWLFVLGQMNAEWSDHMKKEWLLLPTILSCPYPFSP